MMVGPFKFIICNKQATLVEDTGTGQIVHVRGHGYMGTLYLLLNFAITLNCSKK